MKNERLTLPIYNLGCGGGGALMVERTLTKMPGVARAYVNPATEMAYIEYDPALAQPDELAAAVARVGFGPPISMTRGENTPPMPTQPALDAPPSVALEGSITVQSQHSPPAGGAGAFLRSRAGIALIVFFAIATFYLATEHTAHVYGFLPFALLLPCLLMHLFMHGGHGGHGGQNDQSGPDDHRQHQAQQQEGDPR